MDLISSTYPVVLKNANHKQLERAAAANHTELFCANAICNKGDVQMKDGLTWTYAGESYNAMIAFPSLTEINAGQMLDEVVAYYREHPNAGIGCWSIDPPQPANIGIKLLARGFQPGWRPCWMALELGQMTGEHASPQNLKVIADNNGSLEKIKDLPYGRDGAVSRALMEQQPERVRQFIAKIRGKIVGHCSLFFSVGEYSVAGIYDVGVLPSFRDQGIGKALLNAACQYAKDMGYHYAVLNATGRRMYEQAGFQWISNGLTWWLINKRYITNPPNDEMIRFAEAIGEGDAEALNKIYKKLVDIDLDKAMINGMTYVQLAVHCNQQASAQWLIEHGAKYTVLDAWDLGWQDRAADLLKNDPQLVNNRYGDWQITLLHIALERNNIEMARLALSAKPDMTIKDRIYSGTPLDWARYLKREDIMLLIENHLK